VIGKKHLGLWMIDKPKKGATAAEAEQLFTLKFQEKYGDIDVSVRVLSIDVVRVLCSGSATDTS
jgi:hypothetical protein